MDGTHTIERSVPRHLPRARRALHRAVRPARRPRRARCSSRTWCSRATTASDRAGVDEVAEWTLKCFYKHVPAAVPGHRLPLRRPVRRGRDRAPQRDERARAASVAALVLVRPRAAGAGAQGVGRQAGERRGRAARVLPPREDEQRRAHRHLRARDGAGGDRAAGAQRTRRGRLGVCTPCASGTRSRSARTASRATAARRRGAPCPSASA